MLNPSAGLGAFETTSRLASEFDILGLLGQGGGGAVYRARHKLDGSQYAIKRVTFWTRPGAPVHSEAAARRVLREVTALAQLNHPNVCRYYSAWVETDWPSFFNTVSSRASKKSAPAPRMRLLLNPPVDPFSKHANDLGSPPSRRSDVSSSSAAGFDSTENDPDSPLSPVSPPKKSAAEERLSEVSEDSISFSTSANRHLNADPLSIDDPIFQSCQLCASHLGSGVAALMGGSEPGRSDISKQVSMDAVSEDVSESSTTSAGNVDGDSLSSLSSVPHQQRHSTAVAATRPPSLSRQWTYRKELLIQMELCETHTLRDYLEERDRRNTGIDEARSLDCLIQICQGLEHVHSCGIVHRDLKPSNCCFGASNRALKLMDFGLSRQRVNKDGGGISSPTRTRKPGKVKPGSSAFRAQTPDEEANNIEEVDLSEGGLNTQGAGTHSYAAPEQMNGGALLSACDMFPLGLITYELFTSFGSAMERAKAFGELRSQRMPQEFVARLPVLAPLVGRLLSESPKDRPTCSEVLQL